MTSRERPRGTRRRPPEAASSPPPRSLPACDGGVGPTGYTTLMGELNHECGVAAVYHAAGRPVSHAGPDPGRHQQRRAADPADAAGHAEPRAARRGDDQLPPGPQRAAQDPQGTGDGRRGVPAQPPGEVRGDHAGHGRPGRDRPRPLRHLRRRRPQLRPAVRARARPQDQVVRLRLQRPARQLPGAQGGAARPRATTT